MRYEVILKPTAEKALDRFPRFARRRIVDAMEVLRDDPRPAGAAKLAGSQDFWRIRVGDYRVIYDPHAVVTVLRVAHRKDAYRNRGRRP